MPAGQYVPLYGHASTAGAAAPARPVHVPRFRMDVEPVTNAAFLAFVTAHPEWRRSHVARSLADGAYLGRWRGDLDPGPDAPPRSPVVSVSWFAARAYLHARGEDLPTTDQWEYAAAASRTTRDASRDPLVLDRLLAWYSTPTPERLAAVGSTPPNIYGLRDLHGLIWEWTLDFNSVLIGDDTRGVCGAGAAGASDVENYAAFMRYAFRSSLDARYTVANLGFRGVVIERER